MSDQDQQQTPQDPTLSSLYGKTRSVQPPPELDRIVLQAAHKAAPQTPVTTLSSRWHLPLAVAAVLVLSVGIVTTLQREEAEILTEPADFARAPLASLPWNQSEFPLKRLSLIVSVPALATTLAYLALLLMNRESRTVIVPVLLMFDQGEPAPCIVT